VELTGDDVADILRLLDGLPYRELTLETASFRLSLRRNADGEWTQATEVLAEPVAPGWVAAAPPAPATSSAPAADHGVVEHGLADIRAPLLGTFYRAPRPGAAPFVAVGSEVATDTVVCII
jgi:acetyl-CoA carboxylase biotin carboxyl carrier protein